MNNEIIELGDPQTIELLNDTDFKPTASRALNALKKD